MKQDHGKRFEKIISDSWNVSGLNIERLKLNDKDQEAVADEVVIGDKILYIELKSTLMNTFSIRNIKKHQLKSLYKLDLKRKNVRSFLFIEFPIIGKMYAVHINVILEVIKENKSKIDFYDFDKPHMMIEMNDDGYYDMNRFYQGCDYICINL